jgi:sugar/nucleoside kinase (ribokinase family)
MDRRDGQLDVSVAGELNLDLILYGLPVTLEPERELLADRLALTLGSSSAIFAHNLATLGSRVGFIARIGADPFGVSSVERLAAAGVDVTKVRTVPGKTATGLTVILAHASTRHILTYPGAMFEMEFGDLDLDYLASARHFHLSSFFLHRALRPRIPELFRIMKQRGLSTSLDTNDDPDDRWEGGLWETLPHVDVFLPNLREARRITACDDVRSAITRLASVVPVVVVKLGAEGVLARAGKEEITRAAFPANCIDPVGAGDSFDAGFIHQYVRGASLGSCLDWGNRAGALSTTQPGGTEAFRDRAQFESFFPEARRL